MFKIDSLNEPSFSWQRALSLASASQLSYERAHVVENVMKNSWGYQNVRFFDAKDTECFIAESEQHAIIAFRGTKGFGDWVGNLKVLGFKTENYGMVHKGFYDAFHDVRPQLMPVLPTAKPIWLTGHSLGGALASIAAAEWIDKFDINGIFTYGQPRLGDDDFIEAIKGAYADKFFRFVNDDDIVTRIPPGYRHVGRLIHFDSDGSIKQIMTEFDAESAEAEALTQEEFQQIKEDIAKIRESLERHKPAEEVEAALDVSVEGFFPSFQDHRMELYIANIRRQIPEEIADFQLSAERQFVEATDMSFATRGALARGPDQPSDLQFGVLIRLANTSWEPPENLKIGSKFATFATAQVTHDDLDVLKSDPNVVSIEVSRDAGVEDLATSVPFVKADQIHRPPVDERGDAALIGIIDTGIDVLHEAFLDDNGVSRILGVWDQRDNSGPSPHAVDPASFSQDYGTLYVAGDIAGFLGSPHTTPGSLRDPSAHGTHVASIAAGRAVGPNLADGMAPDACLLVVIPNSRTAPGDPPSLGYSVTHVDALYFLKSVAAGNNIVSTNAMPIAVNVSLGMNAGAHDGLSKLEAAFDSVSTSGQDPGYVIIKSAGNERGRGGHASVRAIEGGLINIEWDSSGFRFQDYIEVWYNGRDELRFELIDPAGNTSPVVDENQDQVAVTLGGNHCRLNLETLHPDNGDKLLDITILPQTHSIQDGRWKLHIEGVSLRSGEGWVDAWVERDSARAVRFVPADPNKTLSIPGTAKTVIAVGASDSQIPFSLTSSSSFGLTRDNRAKPDIVAPGTAILAALANDDDHQAAIANTGTSMAAPHVTGALALVMSGRQKSGQPQYNAQQLTAGLKRYAQASGGFHNEGSGWGVLDAGKLYMKLV